MCSVLSSSLVSLTLRFLQDYNEQSLQVACNTVIVEWLTMDTELEGCDSFEPSLCLKLVYSKCNKYCFYQVKMSKIILCLSNGVSRWQAISILIFPANNKRLEYSISSSTTEILFLPAKNYITYLSYSEPYKLYNSIALKCLLVLLLMTTISLKGTVYRPENFLDCGKNGQVVRHIYGKEHAFTPQNRNYVFNFAPEVVREMPLAPPNSVCVS